MEFSVTGCREDRAGAGTQQSADRGPCRTEPGRTTLPPFLLPFGTHFSGTVTNNEENQNTYVCFKTSSKCYFLIRIFLKCPPLKLRIQYICVKLPMFLTTSQVYDVTRRFYNNSGGSVSSASVFSLENKCELREFQVLCGKLHTMLTAQPGLRFPDSNFLSISPQNCLIRIKIIP